jgi:hypothetical protein
MPMYYWRTTNEDSPYDGWHVVVSASDVDMARVLAFDSFSEQYGEQAAFHLDYDPDKIVEGDGAITISWSSD